jgi:pimeloyl-ACP methyl ester carboxylesterase
LGDALGEQMKLVASDVTMIVPPNAGHSLMEEQPQENDGRVAEASLTLCAYRAFDACGGLAALAACAES